VRRKSKDPLAVVATLVRLKARAAEGRLAAERAAEQRALEMWSERRMAALASRASLDSPAVSQAAHAAKYALDSRLRAADAAEQTHRVEMAAAAVARETRREIAVDELVARLKALRR
jgi:hypothetical protein